MEIESSSRPHFASEPADNRGLDPRALTPMDFIARGFVEYSRSIKDPRSPIEDREPLKELARDIRERNDAMVSRFDPCSPAGLYVTRGLEAAHSFAMGLLRQQRRLAEKRSDAEKRRQARRYQNILVLTRQGLMRGGVKLALIGGLFFSMSYALLGFNDAHADKPIIWLSISSACAAMLFGTVWQVIQMDRFQRQIDDSYHREIARAKIEQCEGLKYELDLALSIARDAWCDFTGEECSADDNFELALRTLNSMYGRAHDEEPKAQGALGRMSGLILRVFRSREA